MEDFAGVTLDELPSIEKVFETNIFVYSLEPVEGQPRQTVAHPILRCTEKYDHTLYLNLYQNLFSYIKSMAKYSKSFACSRCGKYWKHVGMLHRHEKTCEAKVQYKFPGGVFKNSKTVFELLEEEGIPIPMTWNYFPTTPPLTLSVCLIKKLCLTILRKSTGKPSM